MFSAHVKSSEMSSDSLFRFTRGLLLKNPDDDGDEAGAGGTNPLNNITDEEPSPELFQGISLIFHSFDC